MKSKYFREYFCSFSSKSYYFYILGVSHLNHYPAEFIEHEHWPSMDILHSEWSTEGCLHQIKQEHIGDE